jgi:uroporphyrinogen-III synthase
MLTDGLRALGATVLELPMVEIVAPPSYEPLDEGLKNLSHYQWLILTSTNAVRVLAERLTELTLPLSLLQSQLQIGVVGAATETALLSLGVKPAVVPKTYVAEALVELLRDRVSGSRVLLVRAAAARDVIPKELAACGAVVDIVVAYQTVRPQHSGEKLKRLLEEGIDAIPFLSSSAVKNFLSFLEEENLPSPPKGVQAISIGPITSATLRDSGWLPAIEAQPSDVSGIIQATKNLFQPY